MVCKSNAITNIHRIMNSIVDGGNLALTPEAFLCFCWIPSGASFSHAPWCCSDIASTTNDYFNTGCAKTDWSRTDTTVDAKNPARP